MELRGEVSDWLNKPGVRDELQRNLPMPALWNRLGPEEQIELLKQLDQNGRPDGANAPQLAANTPGEAADTIPPGQVQLLPVPGSAIIEPSPQQPPDQPPNLLGEVPAESEEIQSDASPEPLEPGQQYAQSILPFLGKPPYYVPARPPGSGAAGRPTQGGPKGAGPEVPKTPGQGNSEPEYKVPIPRQSGKESKNDVPKEYKAIRPYRGEKPRETAERAMDQIQGKGNWNRGTRKRLFDKLKKFYGEHYEEPKEILPPPVTPTDITGREIEASLPNHEENSDQQPSVA